MLRSNSVSGDRMDCHKCARLTYARRVEMIRKVVEEGLALSAAAAADRVSRQTAGKWLRRYREHGVSGLVDRSSRPRRSPRATAAELVMRVEAHRRERWTGVRIAQQLALGTATVSRILCRLKLNRIRMLEPKTVFPRYERKAPGDLLHIDIKKFACIKKPGHRLTGDPRDETRGAGWEFAHVAVDDWNARPLLYQLR